MGYASIVDRQEIHQAAGRGKRKKHKKCQQYVCSEDVSFFSKCEATDKLVELCFGQEKPLLMPEVGQMGRCTTGAKWTTPTTYYTSHNWHRLKCALAVTNQKNLIHL